MKKRNQDKGYINSIKRNRFALCIEILLSLCIAFTVVFVGLNTLSKQTNQYAANINSDYNATVNGYIHEFQMMSTEIKEKINEDLSVEEMDKWLKSRDDIYRTAAGEAVYQGVGLTYKGNQIVSWDNVDFSSFSVEDRPWYKQAQEANGEIVVVAPYTNYTSEATTSTEADIVMSIAQKVNNEITIDYDIKNTGLKELLSNRELIYSDTLMLLCDSDGYILSSSNAEQFGHNIFVADNIVSENFSSQITRLKKSQNRLHFMNVDGRFVVASATTNADGLLFLKMVPFSSVFVQDFLFITIIIILVLCFLIWLYYQNNRYLKEFQRKDERLTCITNASYEERVYVDIETMEFYGNEWAEESCKSNQYNELFTKIRNRILNEEDKIKYDHYLSPNALKKAMDSMYEMMDEHFLMNWKDRQNCEKECTLEISRLASVIDGRQVVGILFNDVTESVEVLKDALKQAESASKAKGEFMSSMSHEIRTPLNAIIGYLDIAKDEKNDEEKVIHCMEQSSVAAKHLLSIINDILDISSIESGRMKLEKADFNLSQMIHSLTTIFYGQAKEKNVKFEVEIQDLKEEWLNGDSLRVNQILLNLLSNAIKFTSANGMVKLIVKETGAVCGKIHLQFQVTDTGIGMSKDYLNRIFKPFEQEDASTARKYGGTGLGLSISYNLVHMMGGKIDVSSEQGIGTTFTINLAFDLAVTEKKEKKNFINFSNLRALVVDDEENACEYIKKLLERCGVKCDTITSAKKAVRRVKNRLSSDYPYDICIIDWNMAEMDGLETAKRIRAICGEKMPIIIASSYDYSSIVDEAKQAGIDKIIPKPLFQSSLFDLLVDIFGKYESIISQEKKKRIDFNGMKVLLAEDNIMNMEIAVDILGKAGMSITYVTNGKEAVDTFISSENGTFEAILMDIQMPLMDGYEATKMIRKSTHSQAKSIPIIAMTANAFTSDVNEALAAGMNDHVSKPISFERLFEVLSRLTAGNR